MAEVKKCFLANDKKKFWVMTKHFLANNKNKNLLTDDKTIRWLLEKKIWLLTKKILADDKIFFWAMQKKEFLGQ